MDIGTLVPALALLTLGLVCVYAILGKKKIEDRREEATPKSTLAKDAPNQR